MERAPVGAPLALDAVVEALGAGMAVFDAAGVLASANAEHRRLHAAHGRDHDLDALLAAARSTGEVRHDEWHGDDDGLVLALQARPVLGPDGQVDGVVLVTEDVTSARQREAGALRRSAEQEVVARLGPLALAATPVAELIEELVRAVAEVVGAEMIGFLELVSGGSEVRMLAAYGFPPEHAHDGRIVPVVEGGHVARVLGSDRPHVIRDAWAEPDAPRSPILDACGVRSSVMTRLGDPPLGVVGAHSLRPGAFDEDDGRFLAAAASAVFGAIERRRAEDALRHLAYHDPLTGLPNRQHLHAHLERALAADPDGVALLLMDLDRFKEVNDVLGHDAGDRLLEQVARRLAVAVGDVGVVSRLGGDEFAVVLERTTPDDAVALARRLEAALRTTFDLGGASVAAGGSIGVAHGTPAGDDPGALLRRADVAMYSAKRDGVGVAVDLGDGDADGGDPSRLVLAAELRRAVEDGQLRLWFQPQWATRTGELRGFEALLRWQHPRLGLLAPGAFLDVLDGAGLHREVTAWVLAAAVAEAATWWRAGHPLHVAVNCSPAALLAGDLADDLDHLLDEAGMPHRALVLEVTEEAVVHALALPQLQRLADQGITVSIDDFGTGFSCLSRLETLPVRELKVDRSFVARTPTSATSRAIVQAIVELGRGLGVAVVAEGAETADELAQVRALGADVVQGYATGRPTPPAGVADLLGTSSPALLAG